MNDFHPQSGKGLSGFMIGLVLATVIIAGVLFFLNQNKTSFKQPEVKREPPSPEIITPGGLSTPPMASAPSSSDVLGDFIIAQTASEPLPDVGALAVPETNTATAAPKATEKPSTTTAAKRTTPTQTGKVSPEQILNSGSLEKAQQEKAQQAKQKATPTKPNPQAPAKTFLQVGSFKDPSAADAQRAKLAILGVDTRVVKSQVNGQNVYRVQTGNLTRQQASQTAERLHNNHIDSLMRTAP